MIKLVAKSRRISCRVRVAIATNLSELVVTAFSPFIIFVSKKSVKALDFGKVISCLGIGGPNVGTDFALLTAML